MGLAPLAPPVHRSLLQVVPGLVLRLGGREVVLQEGLEVFEGGPLVCLLLPAEAHHLVQGLRAALWAGHPVASLHLLQHLTVHHAYSTQNTHSLTVLHTHSEGPSRSAMQYDMQACHATHPHVLQFYYAWFEQSIWDEYNFYSCFMNLFTFWDLLQLYRPSGCKSKKNCAIGVAFKKETIPYSGG